MKINYRKASKTELIKRISRLSDQLFRINRMLDRTNYWSIYENFPNIRDINDYHFLRGVALYDSIFNQIGFLIRDELERGEKRELSETKKNIDKLFKQMPE